MYLVSLIVLECKIHAFEQLTIRATQQSAMYMYKNPNSCPNGGSLVTVGVTLKMLIKITISNNLFKISQARKK